MKKEIKVIDNFLSPTAFTKLNKLIMAENFPWYWSDKSTYEKTTHGKDSFFCHSLNYKEHTNSSFFEEIIKPFKKKIKFKECIRAKINLQYNQGERIKTNYHVDLETSFLGTRSGGEYKTGIYYLNTCNGYTTFKINNAEVQSRKNRMVLFDWDLEHRGISHTDKERRVLINFNFKL
tara:strand:- start:654 stop:1184 length:531 start_codon:yes stop_codon:yes gene_type:complete